MILQKFKWGMKWLLGLSRGGRNFGILPDDVFLVSYPKSGNTWTRFLVANLAHPDEPATFANIERMIPDVYKNTRRQLDQIPRPRILKSHEYFDPRYKKVLYIVRDPRDVVVSYYHYHRKKRVIEDGHPMDLYVSRFISGEVDAFGSWQENVLSWLATRQHSNNFLLIRYEDMLDQPAAELAKVASFLGIKSTPENLTRAVELSSADRMRALEKTQTDVWTITKKSRKDIPFVRTAMSGEWKSAPSEGWVYQIEREWGPTMEMLGYNLATASSGRSSSAVGGLRESLHWRTR